MGYQSLKSKIKTGFRSGKSKLSSYTKNLKGADVLRIIVYGIVILILLMIAKKVMRFLRGIGNGAELEEQSDKTKLALKSVDFDKSKVSLSEQELSSISRKMLEALNVKGWTTTCDIMKMFEALIKPEKWSSFKKGWQDYLTYLMAVQLHEKGYESVYDSWGLPVIGAIDPATFDDSLVMRNIRDYTYDWHTLRAIYVNFGMNSYSSSAGGTPSPVSGLLEWMTGGRMDMDLGEWIRENVDYQYQIKNLAVIFGKAGIII